MKLIHSCTNIKREFFFDRRVNLILFFVVFFAFKLKKKTEQEMKPDFFIYILLG